MRCGINYARRSYESAPPKHARKISIATLAFLKATHIHFCGQPQEPVEAVLNSLVERKWQKECHDFWVNKGISKPLYIQAQADAPRICVGMNVAEVKPAFISRQPNIHTIGDGHGIHIVRGDAMSFTFPSIKDTLITIGTEESDSEIAEGGAWDDMDWSDLPELPKAFFDVFIQYIVALVCYDEPKKFFMEGFPDEYLLANDK